MIPVLRFAPGAMPACARHRVELSVGSGSEFVDDGGEAREAPSSQRPGRSRPAHASNPLSEVTIPLRSNDETILVLGPYDRYAKLLRQALEVDITPRRGNLRLSGDDANVHEAKSRIEHLLGKSRKGRELAVSDIERILLGGRAEDAARDRERGGERGNSRGRGGKGSGGGERENPAARFAMANEAAIRPRALRARPVEPRTENQRRYLEAITKRDLVFGSGPAGTGKTYLAVSAAVMALRAGRWRRLVITRPRGEAGEELGVPPGRVQQKLNPYMRPIYDALYDQLPFEEVARLEETGVIEVAPLAYMRGRTLNHAFVILDEAQNTTVPQMKMFLTRLGEGSRMAVTGDPKQSDLAPDKRNGLVDAIRRLRGMEGIAVCEFEIKDIVRHSLVARIVRAYDGPQRREGADDGRVADGEVEEIEAS